MSESNSEELANYCKSGDVAILANLPGCIQDVLKSYSRAHPTVSTLSMATRDFFNPVAENYLPIIYHRANTCWFASSMWFIASMRELMKILQSLPTEKLEYKTDMPKRVHRGVIVPTVNILRLLAEKMSITYSTPDSRQMAFNEFDEILPCILPMHYQYGEMMDAGDQVLPLLDLVPEHIRDNLFWQYRVKNLRTITFHDGSTTTQSRIDQEVSSIVKRFNDTREKFLRTGISFKSESSKKKFLDSFYEPLSEDPSIPVVNPPSNLWAKLSELLLRMSSKDARKIFTFKQFWNVAHGLNASGVEVNKNSVYHNAIKNKRSQITNYYNVYLRKSVESRKAKGLPTTDEGLMEEMKKMLVEKGDADDFEPLKILHDLRNKKSVLTSYSVDSTASTRDPYNPVLYLSTESGESVQKFIDSVISEEIIESDDIVYDSFTVTDSRVGDFKWKYRDYIVIQLIFPRNPSTGENILPKTGNFTVNDRITVNGQTFVLNSATCKYGGGSGGHWWTEVVKDATEKDLEFIEYDDMHDSSIINTRRKLFFKEAGVEDEEDEDEEDEEEDEEEEWSDVEEDDEGAEGAEEIDLKSFNNLTIRGMDYINTFSNAHYPTMLCYARLDETIVPATPSECLAKLLI